MKPLRPSPESNCRFCEIVARKTDAAIVFENEVSLAFLDSRPLFPGHCLLVPKTHYETLADVPEKLVRTIFANAQRLATVVQQAMKADGTFVAMNNVVSQSVPHFHIHIVPRRHRDGLRGFFWPRRKYASDQEQNSVRDKLISHVNRETTRHGSAGAK